MNNEKQDTDHLEKNKFLSVSGDISSILGFLLTIVCLVGASKNENKYTIVFYVTGLIIFILSIIAFFNRKKISEKTLSIFMNMTAPNKGYKLRKKTVVYEILSIDKMSLEKTFLVQPLCAGFDRLNDKFRWSGNPDLDIEPSESKFRIERNGTRDGMQRYSIVTKNSKQYGKNETVNMGMKISNFIDKDRSSLPYLSSGIFEPTDELLLKVIFDGGLKPKKFRKLEYIHYTDDAHYKCDDRLRSAELNQKTNKKIVEWSIKNPIYGGKYVIDWEYEE